MNSYTDQAIARADLSADGNEVGSTFTRCTFANDPPIEGVNFSFAVFDDCTFERSFGRCNFAGAEGTSKPKDDDLAGEARMKTNTRTRTEWLAARPGSLEIECDATDDYSPTDGVPDIEADGASTTTITVRKLDADGALDDQAVDEVDLACTRGRLSALRVKLAAGVGTVVLTSAPETCVAVVQATLDGVASAKLRVQFAPVSP
jgi:hypothetical protein